MYQRKKKAIATQARTRKGEAEEEGVSEEVLIEETTSRNKEVPLRVSCLRCMRVSVVLSTTGFYLVLAMLFVFYILLGVTEI